MLTHLPLIIFISAMIMLSGCQEDDRGTRTTALRASELANERLGTATDGLFETLGKGTTGEGPEEKAKPPKALSWSAPTTREDGSALKPDQIAGFRIYYRLRHETRFNVIPVNSPERTSQPLTQLPPGAYEFAITTIDAQGLESRRSSAVMVDLI
ncbi:fibronectin type III domain-containing protein [Marinobacter sp.]|uniref:fibronectin type III domain-containing protein n=1 Tax=Marinobacter sp. TaxID=50741 RepID=UPI003A947EFC